MRAVGDGYAISGLKLSQANCGNGSPTARAAQAKNDDCKESFSACNSRCGMNESGTGSKRNLAKTSGYPRRRAGGAPLARERAPRWVTGAGGRAMACGSCPLKLMNGLAPGENRRSLFTFSSGRARSHMERWAFHRHPQGDNDDRCEPTTLLHSAAQTSRSPHRAVAQGAHGI